MRRFFGAIGDRIVIDGGETLRRWIVWPLLDGFERPGRAFAVGLVVLLSAGVGVSALALGVPKGSNDSSATEAAAAQPLAHVPPSPSERNGAPTLHGAAPDFKATAKEPAEVGSAEALESAAPDKPSAGQSSSAASAVISSDPKAGTSTVDSPPAGPAAIAVAREFASAFVAYETGGDKALVREALGKTATQELSRSLLRRPPRLPASVKVPKAKVLNVVAGPSRGPVYSVSVSLLRLGVTSELRLDMERVKKAGWRVTNVLG